MHQDQLHGLLLLMFTKPELTSSINIDMMINEFKTIGNKNNYYIITH